MKAPLELLRAFDGKHVQPLEELVLSVVDDPQAIDSFLDFSESEEAAIQVGGATWVLKRLQEEGKQFSAKQVTQLLELLNSEAWEARLHLLQILPTQKIPKRGTPSAFSRIKIFLESEKNKFVRAWSYNALIIIADQYSEYREEVAAIIKTGQPEEAASVKARICNVIKSVEWL